MIDHFRKRAMSVLPEEVALFFEEIRTNYDQNNWSAKDLISEIEEVIESAQLDAYKRGLKDGILFRNWLGNHDI